MNENIYGVFGALIQGANFESLERAYNLSKQFGDREKLHLEKEPTLLTFLMMLQDEYDYRTPCDECKEDVGLNPSFKF